MLIVSYCNQSMSVIRRPLSVVPRDLSIICYKRQLLLHSWANFNQTSQECCLDDYLPKQLFLSHINKQDGHQS